MGENIKLDWKTISHAGDREERDGRYDKIMVIVDLGPGIALGKEGNTFNKGGSPVPQLTGVSASLLPQGML